jgi:hypothetical protein
MNRYFLSGLIAIALISLVVRAQQPDKHQSMMTQQQMDEMNRRGDKAMGFDHLKTTHHFLLANNGGSIKVEANDPMDTESRDQIRQHLQHIAMMFSEGNFAAPMLVHDKTPPGTKTMSKLKAKIKYEYKETERGALIEITTGNAEAMEAIHDFLRFQIKEHMTGDPLEVKQ